MSEMKPEAVEMMTDEELDAALMNVLTAAAPVITEKEKITSLGQLILSCIQDGARVFGLTPAAAFDSVVMAAASFAAHTSFKGHERAAVEALGAAITSVAADPSIAAAGDRKGADMEAAAVN